MNGELHIVDDVHSAFAKEVAAAFATRPRPRLSLVLSGGPTARACYEELAHAERYPLDWPLVDVFMGDERCVPPDDPDANQRLVHESLLDEVGPVGSFHPMSCDAGAESYERLLARELDASDELDVIHLGLGPDGHTASLFPGSPDLEAPPERLALLTSDPTSRNPHPRMTVTFSLISRAHLVIFTVAGTEKREALDTVRRGGDVPAARVRAERILWLADHEAAGE
jgi:6-phosphogluconolactonase